MEEDTTTEVVEVVVVEDSMGALTQVEAEEMVEARAHQKPQQGR